MDTRQQIKIYDCTLREGSQASEVSFSIPDKIKITHLLDEMGFAYTEGGWPSSNAKDQVYFDEIKKASLRHIKVVGFGRTRFKDKTAEEDTSLSGLLKTGVACGHIFGKGWDFHVREVLRISLEQNLETIYDSIQFLKKHMEEVSFGFEHFFDGYKSNPEYSLSVIQTAVDAGVDWIDLADTNGGCFPDEVATIVSTMTRRFTVPFAVHCHNDTGCGVANTLAAVKSGVRIVEGTVNGYSERCGMADLCTVIANLQLKLGYRCIPDDKVKDLTRLSREVVELLQTDPLKWHPYVGSLAFTHKGGVHVDAFLKNPRTYEHIDPALVGNQSNVVVSEVSGKSNLAFFLRKHGLAEAFADEEAKALLGVVKHLEACGFEFNTVEESLLLVILRESGRFRQHIDFKTSVLRFVNGPRAMSATEADASDRGPEKPRKPTAVARRRRKSTETQTIEVESTVEFFPRNGESVCEDAKFVLNDEETSFSWVIAQITKQCAKHFAELERIELVDYQVRAISDRRGIPYRIRVVLQFKDDVRTWKMLGLGRNVVSATLNAMVDAFEYRLNIDELVELGKQGNR